MKVPSRELHLVSVAHSQTFPVWKVAQKALLKRVKCDTYTVIVPEQDLPLFSSIANPRVTVTSEESFAKDIRPLLRQKLPEDSDRFGWYLQQFLKLAAVREITHHSSAIIWDADTVPLRSIQFFTDNFDPIFFVGTENHLPYFAAIERVLGLEKYEDFSFIAQNFPVKKEFGQAFFSTLEVNGEKWFEPLIAGIDFAENSGFSEYETMGTFMSHRFRSSFHFQKKAWLRNGWLIFSSPLEALSPIKSFFWSRKYAYCSFEKWQQPRTAP